MTSFIPKLQLFHVAAWECTDDTSVELAKSTPTTNTKSINHNQSHSRSCDTFRLQPHPLTNALAECLL